MCKGILVMTVKVNIYLLILHKIYIQKKAYILLTHGKSRAMKLAYQFMCN